MMVGRPVELVVAKQAAEPKQTVLEVRDLEVLDDRNHQAVKHVSFDVRAGEIVGIAGVQGNGQSELVAALTGLRSVMGGSVKVNGKDLTHATPRAIHEAGVAHIPEDRQRSGLVLGFTITENMVLDSYHAAPYSKGLSMDWDVTRSEASRLVEQYDIRTPTTEAPASTLSGGNQQKVIVAREFSSNVDLVIASQPTRGVDVGSIEYIHEQIVAQRDQGSAILIVSTELDEVMALSDRILVMFRGQIIAERTPEETTNTELGLFMAGVTESV